MEPSESIHGLLNDLEKIYKYRDEYLNSPVVKFTAIGIAIFLAVFILTILFIFPIYVIIFQLNLFDLHFNSPFFYLTVLIEMLLPFWICLMAYYNYYMSHERSYALTMSMTIYGAAIYICTIIMVNVQNILLFILALQRFLLYFFPAIGKRYFNNSFLVILSALAYLAILVSVKRFAKTMKYRKTRPETLLLIHTALIVLIKIFYAPFVIYIAAYFPVYPLDISFFFVVLIDIFTTSFVVQVSYLNAHREAIGSLMSWRFSSISLFDCYKVNNVAPETNDNELMLSIIHK
ncbi:unnamed protein product [Caenorhabditis bovis]|uniref:Uncharacterized protein n=1 Tax=Caenorhabditis bovis TaxID=2654633 RepID=A0A8S1F7U4_9PELO|nr:unnamed protein product [Caenorhabditis bovis]